MRSKVDRVYWARNTPSELPLFCFPVPPTTNFSPHICKEELPKQIGETDIWLVPFTYVQNFQKVENEKKRNFAIHPSRLVRKLFCKKPSLKNNIFHNFCFLYVLNFSKIPKKILFVFMIPTVSIQPLFLNYNVTSTFDPIGSLSRGEHV